MSTEKEVYHYGNGPDVLSGKKRGRHKEGVAIKTNIQKSMNLNNFLPQKFYEQHIQQKRIIYDSLSMELPRENIQESMDLNNYLPQKLYEQHIQQKRII